MPELPEVEITARLIGAAVAGARIESSLAPGVNALKTYDPPLSALDGRTFTGVRRRGKLFVASVEGVDLAPAAGVTKLVFGDVPQVVSCFDVVDAAGGAARRPR